VPSYINFYENLNEARLRLLKNVVSYEGRAYYVLEIVDNPDGKFRIYLDPVGPLYGCGRDKWTGFPQGGTYNTTYAQELDKWIDNNPESGVLRRYMSSRGFNKYRPFPLGNMNKDGKVFYVERTPTRRTDQGLRENSVLGALVTTTPPQEPSAFKKAFGNSNNYLSINLLTPEFADTVAGSYPSFEEVVTNLRDPRIANDGVAFSREFSVLRGPVDTLCLCFKADGVGLIDDNNGLVLGRDYKYLYESVQELDVFSSIKFR
jgi:hypothetical protein